MSIHKITWKVSFANSYKTLPYQRSDDTNVNKIMKNHKAQPNNITPFELRSLISIRGDILLSQWKKKDNLNIDNI